MVYHPAFAMMALVLAILLGMASWSWLRFVKYPTTAYRDLAGRTTAWALGFAGIMLALMLVTLA